MRMAIHFLLLTSLLPIVALGNGGCGHSVRFVVTDEQGKPIKDATAVVSYQTGFIPGEGFGRDTRRVLQKKTDAKGVSAFRIFPFGERKFGFAIRDLEGRYYDSVAEREVRYKEGEGRTERQITLRAKRNPIPLFLPSNFDFYFPMLNGKAVSLREPVGFDAVIGDWLPPYGKGKVVDFVFRSRYEDVGETYVRDHRGMLMINDDWKYSAAFSWTFANVDDGIIEAPRHWPTSVLPVEREAPANGYQKEFRMEWHRPAKPTDYQKDAKRQHFFRIRTQRDSKGEIVYALYGKLLREPLFGDLRFEDCQFFYYCLNLTPMDRILEYNGENLEEDTALRAHVNADYVRRFPSVLLQQSERLRALPSLAEVERESPSKSSGAK